MTASLSRLRAAPLGRLLAATSARSVMPKARISTLIQPLERVQTHASESSFSKRNYAQMQATKQMKQVTNFSAPKAPSNLTPVSKNLSHLALKMNFSSPPYLTDTIAKNKQQENSQAAFTPLVITVQIPKKKTPFQKVISSIGSILLAPLKLTRFVALKVVSAASHLFKQPTSELEPFNIKDFLLTDDERARYEKAQDQTTTNYA